MKEGKFSELLRHDTPYMSPVLGIYLHRTINFALLDLECSVKCFFLEKVHRNVITYVPLTHVDQIYAIL